MSQIVVEKVDKVFRSGDHDVVALKGIDLEIPRG